jgi:hypothetical protein
VEIFSELSRDRSTFARDNPWALNEQGARLPEANFGLNNPSRL